MSINERIFEKQLNIEIVAVQSKLSAQYGWDSKEVVTIVRDLDKQARAQKSVQPIKNYRQHVLGE